MSTARLFTLKTMHQFADGDLDRDFMEAMAAAAKDCTNRSAIEKARTVSLVVKMLPKRNQDGTCDDVLVHVQVVAKQPAKQMDLFQMRTTANGGLKYQPDSPLNPDQPGLGFDGSDKE